MQQQNLFCAISQMTPAAMCFNVEARYESIFSTDHATVRCLGWSTFNNFMYLPMDVIKAWPPSGGGSRNIWAWGGVEYFGLFDGCFAIERGTGHGRGRAPSPSRKNFQKSEAWLRGGATQALPPPPSNLKSSNATSRCQFSDTAAKKRETSAKLSSKVASISLTGVPLVLKLQLHWRNITTAKLILHKLADNACGRPLCYLM